MEETWKDIPRYIGYYQVSNIGRVRSIDRFVTGSRTGRKTHPRHGKIRSPIKRDDKWYLKIDLLKEGHRKSKFVHRLVAEAFLPNPDNLAEVNHKDGNKQNNNVDNLEWCTISYNRLHAIRTGLTRILKGAERYGAILNDDKVKQIRAMYPTGLYTQKEIGKMFGVGGKTIGNIINRVKWKHVA